jgi:hypothetical protein
MSFLSIRNLVVQRRTALHLYVPGQASPSSDNAPFMLRIFGFLISAIYGVVKGGLSCARVAGVVQALSESPLRRERQ